MCDIFKFCEHGLTEQSRAELLKVHVQQVFSHFLFIFGAEQMLHQKRFVDGRCDFCSEYRMTSVNIRLFVSRIAGVHGMPHLMDDRENIL